MDVRQAKRGHRVPSLGRGLVSQGRLADGEHALVASLQRAPSIEAYETLTTIAVKTDRRSSTATRRPARAR